MEYRRLADEIEQINLKMSTLSPIYDFALYFKNERMRNNLLDKQAKICRFFEY